MSETATNTETQGAFAALAKALGIGTTPDPSNAAAEAIAKVLDDHGDEAVTILTAAFGSELAKDAATTDADDDGDDPDPLEAKVDALAAKFDAFLAAKPAETVAKSGEDTPAAKLAAALAATTAPKSAAVRDTLIKSGVPAVLVEAAGDALESDDPKAAAATRGMLAKLAGIADVEKLLKEQGTTQSTDPTPTELDDATKKAAAAMVAGL